MRGRTSMAILAMLTIMSMACARRITLRPPERVGHHFEFHGQEVWNATMRTLVVDGARIEESSRAVGRVAGRLEMPASEIERSCDQAQRAALGLSSWRSTKAALHFTASLSENAETDLFTNPDAKLPSAHRAGGIGSCHFPSCGQSLFPFGSQLGLLSTSRPSS